VTEHLILGRQPLLLNGDVSEQLEQMGIEPIGRPCASFVGVPILSDGEAIGVIALQDYETAGRFGRHELGVLNIVGTQASAAIRNARLFEATRRAFDELSAAQARLLEAVRLRSINETVGALNHEVNNPLATIVGTAQLLLRNEHLEPGTRQKLERMLEAAKRIGHVTGKMATLIQANSRPYPGQTAILDLRGSLARGEQRQSPTASGIYRAVRQVLGPRAPEPAAGTGPGPVVSPESETKPPKPEAGAA
jgi:GAF domain-containing protein